jgi:predicted phage terminase large subunit-like protein
MEIDTGGQHKWDFRRGDALFPERFTVEELIKIERDIGRTNYCAQYLQRPIWTETVTIDEAWFPRYQHDEIGDLYDRVIQSWDTALTSQDNADYSVCTTWGVDGHNFYLLNVFRERLDYRILYRKVIELQSRYRAHTVIIERAGSGTMLLHDLRRERYRWAAGCSPRFGKEERAHGQISKMEAARVFLPESAPWLDVFLNELRLFPRARNDDQIDSMVQLLEVWDSTAHGMRRGLRFSPPTQRYVRARLI